MQQQVRLLSMADLCKQTKRSAPYLRALADSGAIDSFVVSGSGWRAFPRVAVQQVRDHEQRKAAVVQA